MSSILFIEKSIVTDKLGIMYLISVLKNAGHSVDMVQDDIDSADEYLKRKKVDFIMYSVITGDHKWFIEKNRKLKNKFDFISVVGGPHFTFFPEDGLNDSGIDYVVQGPGEAVILDVVENKVKGKLVRANLLEDLDSLPYADRAVFYKYDNLRNARMKRFMVCRDCPNACAHCFNHLYHELYRSERHNFYKKKSPENVYKEINAVRKMYNLELVFFNDDDFAADKRWLSEFCSGYKKGIGLPYCGSIRANSADYGTLKLLADTGCVFLNIGLESAVLKTQKLLRRGAVSNEQIEEACKACNSLNIKVRLQNMIGLPVDDPLDDALKTLEFNQKINPTDSWASIYQPFPKTALWKHCLDKGFIASDTECVHFYERTNLKIPDAEKINRLHRWWFFFVKHQIPIDLVNIILDIPLSSMHKKRILDLRFAIAKRVLYGM